jgi:hypothetical protein
VTDEDALLHGIAIVGGRLRVRGGMQCRALALPETRRISLAALKRVKPYVADGGTVIGLKPQSAAGRETLQSQAAFRVLAERLWGAQCPYGSHHAYGKGQVFCTADAHAKLAAMGVPPDVTVLSENRSVLGASSTTALDYIHQRIGATDLYFLRNGSDKIWRHRISFRITGELPQVWDALTGTMQAAPGARLLPDGRVEAPVTLPPFGSSILVFAGSIGHSASPASLSTNTVPVTVSEKWSIAFPVGCGAPQPPVETTTLRSWTTWGDPDVRYFSGTAIYRATLSAPAVAVGRRRWLRFPDVREIGQLTINGKPAGTVWAEPVMLRVDTFLHPGANRIAIEVPNLWPNRIIGDMQPSVKKRCTSTNIRKYKADSPLLLPG